jgi:hypothetical protein
MTSACPKLQGPEDVYPWAMHHEAASAERWRNQEALNDRSEEEMSGLRKRVTAIEIRVAVFAAIGGLIGGLMALVPSFLAAATK